MFNGSANLSKFIEGNAINITREIPIFFVAKHYVMKQDFAKIYICACLNFRIQCLLAIFPTAFSFRFTSFSSIKNPINFTSAVAGNPRLHHIKTMVLNCLNTPFQVTIVSLFVFDIVTFKTRAMFAPIPPAVKKPYGASLRGLLYKVQLI